MFLSQISSVTKGIKGCSKTKICLNTKDETRELKGLIECGLMPTFTRSALPNTLSRFLEENPKVDVRSLCLIRETLAKHDGLADFSFAMQGLGSMPISLHGNSEQQKFWLPKIQSGHAISAFALSEPRSGSDVANLELMAKRERNGYVLNGEKTWIC